MTDKANLEIGLNQRQKDMVTIVCITGGGRIDEDLSALFWTIIYFILIFKQLNQHTEKKSDIRERQRLVQLVQLQAQEIQVTYIGSWLNSFFLIFSVSVSSTDFYWCTGSERGNRSALKKGRTYSSSYSTSFGTRWWCVMFCVPFVAYVSFLLIFVDKNKMFLFKTAEADEQVMACKHFFVNTLICINFWSTYFVVIVIY